MVVMLNCLLIRILFKNFFQTIQRLFQTSRDNVYKNYRLWPRLKDNKDWNNLSFKKNLKLFKKKSKNAEVKTDLFSIHHIILIFSIQKLQSKTTSNIWLFLSYFCYLKTCIPSKLTKVFLNKSFRPTFRCWGLFFRRKTKTKIQIERQKRQIVGHYIHMFKIICKYIIVWKFQSNCIHWLT